METKKKVRWTDLPPELWPVIGNRLGNRVDVLRFRSVCMLWRSSLSPFQQPPAPLLPFRFSPVPAVMDIMLFKTTVYRMESIVAGEDEPDSPEPWLVKFEEYDSGNMRLLDPISNKPLRYSPIALSSKQLNLLDFRVVELRKSYSLNKRNAYHGIFFNVNKVVIVGPNCWDDCVLFMICNGGTLGCLRFGGDKWTNLDPQNSHYDDLIVDKDQCYVVDRWGTVSWVNSELKAIRVSPPLDGFGWEKHLVESCGDIYVIDRYLHTERRPGDLAEDHIFGPFSLPPFDAVRLDPNAEEVDFKVYKLDQERGRWVDVKNLGDRVFILSNDGSFSVSSRDFARVKGNCILFTTLKHGGVPIKGGPGRSYPTRVFNLEDGCITTPAAMSGYSAMLRPPSAWLSQESIDISQLCTDALS